MKLNLILALCLLSFIAILGAQAGGHSEQVGGHSEERGESNLATADC
jgi:hypothetical protein